MKVPVLLCRFRWVMRRGELCRNYGMCHCGSSGPGTVTSLFKGLPTRVLRSNTKVGQPHDNNAYCEYLGFTYIAKLTENIRVDPTYPDAMQYSSYRYSIVSVMGPDHGKRFKTERKWNHASRKKRDSEDCWHQPQNRSYRKIPRLETTIRL
jgi:hypothetical protein